MKTRDFTVCAVMLLAVFAQGCALLTPPPYMDQKMVIERDVSGKVIASKYERTVKGLSNQDPGTVINQWSYADSLARMSAGGEYRKAVEEKGFAGMIINQSPYYTYSVEIVSAITNLPVSVALMTPNIPMTSWVPAPGEYYDVWKKDGVIVARGKFTVRDDKLVSYGNYQNLYWYSVKSYP